MEQYHAWRIAALILFAVMLACAFAVYDTTQKLAGCMKANRALSQAYADADAGVELAVHPRSGDVLLRVNGKHIHQFKGACAKVRL